MSLGLVLWSKTPRNNSKRSKNPKIQIFQVLPCISPYLPFKGDPCRSPGGGGMDAVTWQQNSWHWQLPPHLRMPLDADRWKWLDAVRVRIPTIKNRDIRTSKATK